MVIKAFLMGELVKPLLRRVGTGLGAYLIGLGATQDTASTIVAGAIALAGVAVDLLGSNAERTGRR